MTTLTITFFDPRKPFLNQVGQMTRDAFTRLDDLIRRTGGENGQYMAMPSRTVAELQAIAANEDARPKESAVALCSNESGGATLVFYVTAELQWRRAQDRAVIS